LVVAAGPKVGVTGVVVSIVTVTVVTGEIFPAGSVASTLNIFVPVPRGAVGITE
jgi:hypothetical protein